MAQKKKKTKKSARRADKALAYLTKVSDSLEKIQAVQSELQTKLEQLPVATTEAVKQTSTTTLDELVAQQQKEAAQKIRDEILPQARSAQRFYGYLTVSVDGGDFKMEKVESVARLEEILNGIDKGTTRVLMNPFAAQPKAQPFVQKTVEVKEEVALDGVSQTKTTTTTTIKEKRGIFSRIASLLD